MAEELCRDTDNTSKTTIILQLLIETIHLSLMVGIIFKMYQLRLTLMLVKMQDRDLDESLAKIKYDLKKGYLIAGLGVVVFCVLQFSCLAISMKNKLTIYSTVIELLVYFTLLIFYFIIMQNLKAEMSTFDQTSLSSEMKNVKIQ